MPTALQPTSDIPIVTTDQLDLIKRTVAHGATADELKLYLFDCARQGVHPLDKLVHFTKRGGKYTPVTSIDFMRIRAAETGEYAGSEDAVFAPPLNTAPYPPAAAFVRVYRLVQGQQCAFSATARWSEYKPDQDFMWLKMPHTMLGKCAEALALRKGFPRQLAGLYAKEEMDQAEVSLVSGTKPEASPASYATVNEPPPPEDEPAPLPPVGFVLDQPRRYASHENAEPQSVTDLVLRWARGGHDQSDAGDRWPKVSAAMRFRVSRRRKRRGGVSS